MQRVQRGFTLLEMVLVIILVAIMAPLLANLLTGPVQAYIDVGRRTELTERAAMALTRIARELPNALPNSVRVDATGQALEFVPAVDGGRYRAVVSGTPATPGDILDFSAADSSFDVLGQLKNNTNPSGNYVVVNNTSDALVYGGSDRAQIAGYSAGGASYGYDQLTIASTLFPAPSPQQRFFIVTTPVSFICAAGQLKRHEGYGFSASQSTAPGGSSSLLLDKVSSCAISYQAGSYASRGLVTMRVTVSDAALGDSITLLQQIHVLNSP